MSTDVIVNAGDDYTGDRHVILPAATEDGTPIDIDGYDFTFTVAERVSGDIVIVKTSDYGDVTAAVQDYDTIGVAYVELAGSDTLLIGNGPLNYELTGIDYEFRERTLLQGRFYVTTGNETGS